MEPFTRQSGHVTRGCSSVEMYEMDEGAGQEVLSVGTTIENQLQPVKIADSGHTGKQQEHQTAGDGSPECSEDVEEREHLKRKRLSRLGEAGGGATIDASCVQAEKRMRSSGEMGRTGNDTSRNKS